MKIDLEKNNLNKIEEYLSKNNNQTIKEISFNLKLNRNTCAKYLEILNAKNKIIFKLMGRNKVYNYNLNQNIDYLINYIPTPIIIYENTKIKFINSNFKETFKVNDEIIDKNINTFFKTKTNLFLKEILKCKKIIFCNKIYYIEILEKVNYNQNTKNTLWILVEKTYEYNIKKIVNTYNKNKTKSIIEKITNTILCNNNILELQFMNNNKNKFERKKDHNIKKTIKKTYKINNTNNLKITSKERISKDFDCLIKTMLNQVKDKI